MPSACNSWIIKLLENLTLVEICLISHQVTSSGFWLLVLRQPCLSPSQLFSFIKWDTGSLAQIRQGSTAGAAC